jgi:hypothetical protein
LGLRKLGDSSVHEISTPFCVEVVVDDKDHMPRIATPPAKAVKSFCMVEGVDDLAPSKCPAFWTQAELKRRHLKLKGPVSELPSGDFRLKNKPMPVPPVALRSVATSSRKRGGARSSKYKAVKSKGRGRKAKAPKSARVKKNETRAKGEDLPW